MQEEKINKFGFALILLFLGAFSLNAGDVVLAEIRPFYVEFPTLENALQRDGHRIFGHGVVDIFVAPESFDAYWILPDNAYLADSNIAQLEHFVKTGGHLILIVDCRGDIVEVANRIFRYEVWFEELGRPQAYNEYVRDSVPDTFIDYFGYLSSSFILNFDSRWERGEGIDTLITGLGASVGVETDGRLRAVGWGARDSYGHPYSADTAVYDSFAVQILAGNYHEGEITVVADVEPFSTLPYGETDIITLFDNLQFARQLFACNQRADSAALEQADSTLSLRIFGEFTDFDPDSCEWRFRILHVLPLYEFRGHEIGARFIAPDLLEIDYPPIYNPVYDTVEVCVMFLQDYDGETVLWDFPVCDTFRFDFSAIAETPTPEYFEISAYPNPFNSAVTISLTCHSRERGNPEIEIYDVTGRLVAEIPINGSESAKSLSTLASGACRWQPEESLGSGVYFIRASIGNETVTKNIVYLK